MREECGIFGISNHSDASALVALGLHALQHRGQEGCGIVSFDGNNYHSEKRQGLVGDHFTNLETLKNLPGAFAIGHNRYSTSGETSLRNIQPFFADLHLGGLSLAHNGNLTNAISLRETLVKEGAIFIFTLFITIIIGKTLSKAVSWTGVGSIDKVFGFLFGFFKGYIVCVCLFSIFNWFYPYQNWGISAKDAISFNFISKGSEVLIDEFPSSEDFIDTKEKIEKI